MRDISSLSGAEIDTLTALIEVGPLFDGDVPSKYGRDLLLTQGMAVRVVCKGEDGFTAATYLGRDAYKRYWGNSKTLHDAMKFRKMQAVNK